MPSPPQSPDTPPEDPLRDPLAPPKQELGAEDLAIFEDIPIVVTPSRAATPQNLSPAPIGILTAKDLHYGGWISVPDALQFVPGVDVMRADRRRDTTGVRGLHEIYSDRTLTLVDGRRAVSVAFGGAEFHRLPLLIEDIAQVEVVRGPGGAAWGSDALNGVIHVLTKAPADIAGTKLSATLTQYGDVYTHARWAGVADDLSWRVSAGWQQYGSSRSDLDLAPSTPADDWSMLTFDSELRYELGDDMRISGGVGITDQQAGSFELFGYEPGIDHELQTLRTFARFDGRLGPNCDFFVQTYYNAQRTEAPTISDRYSEDEWVLETQFGNRIGEDHHLTFGADLRYRNWAVESSSPFHVRTEDSRYEGATLGLFGVEKWQATPDFSVELQLRGDTFTEGDFDWSGRLTGIYTHDPEGRQVSRLSVARAYRFLTVWGEVAIQRQPYAGGYLYTLDSADDIDNESMLSFEAGHAIQLTDRLHLEANAYYQRYHDLVGLTAVSATPPVHERFDNVGSATAMGLELETRYTAEDWSLLAWYAWNEFETERDGVSPRAVEPARHKAGLLARWHAAPGLTLQSAFKYTGESRDTDGDKVDAFHRLDLTVSQRLEGIGELQIGVWDVFDEMGEVVPNNGSNESPGRTFFLRLQVDL